MLLKKSTHFLLAGMLVLTDICATASDSEQAPLKTPEQQKRADDLLEEATSCSQDIINRLKEYGLTPNSNFFQWELQPCQTHKANPRQVARERNDCLYACSLMFSKYRGLAVHLEKDFERKR